MPLPALVPLAAKAAPWIVSAVGTMLPVIVDSFRSGKSPEEAAKIVEPKRQEIVDRLIGTGMNRQAAEAMADESIKGELSKAQLPEQMNPWIATALAIGGGIGGYKLGSKLAGKMAPAGNPSQVGDKVSEEAAPKAATVAASEVDSATSKIAGKPFPTGNMADAETMAAQTHGRSAEMRSQILDDLESRPMDKDYYDKLKTLDDGTQGLVDEMMPKRPFLGVPEFMGGEMQSRTPSAMLRPWESMPEVEGAMIRKELRRLKADPRGIVNVAPPETGPFPDPDAARSYSRLYRYAGG